MRLSKVTADLCIDGAGAFEMHQVYRRFIERHSLIFKELETKVPELIRSHILSCA